MGVTFSLIVSLYTEQCHVQSNTFCTCQNDLKAISVFVLDLHLNGGVRLSVLCYRTGTH